MEIKILNPEIKAAKEYGAVAVGVASNEQKGRGWNQRKMERLINAGADLMIPDFRGVKRLLQYIDWNYKYTYHLLA